MYTVCVVGVAICILVGVAWGSYANANANL